MTTAERLLGVAKKHEEKLRFLVTGGFNTFVGYGLFAVLLHVFGQERYNLAFAVQWVISVSISYATFKTFVFRTRGTNWVAEWLRSYLVYSASFVINLALLNLFVRVLHLHPLYAQLACIFLVTIVSYFGHKYFTFRHVVEPLGAADLPPDGEDLSAAPEPTDAAD